MQTDPKHGKCPRLSILIPVGNSAQSLRATLESITASISHSSNTDQVEICCVDNQSQDETQRIVQDFANCYPFIKYYRHEELKLTVEQSISSGVVSCRGEFVWTIGDRDLIALEAIDTLLKVVGWGKYRLILPNTSMWLPTAKRECLCVDSDSFGLCYERGLDFFKDFGFTNTNSAFSRPCFDREKFLSGSSNRPYSLALFQVFASHPAFFLNTPLIAHQGPLQAHGSSATELLTLIERAADQLGLPLHWFSDVQELEFDKDTKTITPTVLPVSLLRMICALLRTAERTRDPNDLPPLEFTVRCRNFFQSTPLDAVAKTVLAYSDSLHPSRPQTGPQTNLADIELALTRFNSEHFAVRQGDQSDGTLKHLLFIGNDSRPTWIRGEKVDADGAIAALPESEQPLLSIMIPTYNRGGKLLRLLGTLFQNGISGRSDIEIVCVDNRSTDITARVCRFWEKRFTNFRSVRREKHLPSAEENVSASVEFCRGTYVWALGDDDLVIFQNLPLMLYCLRSSGSDYCLFNFNKKFAHESRFPDLPAYQPVLQPGLPFLHAPLRDLVAQFGFTTSCASISATIFRRAAFREFDEYIKISRIYSHVAAYLHYFADKRCSFFNFPLITYIDGDDHLERFAELAKNVMSPFYYPWTIGIVAHIRALERAGKVKPGYFFEIHELGHGRPYLLASESMAQFVRQLMICLKTGRAEHLFAKQDADLFLDYFETQPKFRKYLPFFRNAFDEMPKLLKGKSPKPKMIQTEGTKVELVCFPREFRRVRRKLDTMLFKLDQHPRPLLRRIASWQIGHVVCKLICRLLDIRVLRATLITVLKKAGLYGAMLRYWRIAKGAT